MEKMKAQRGQITPVHNIEIDTIKPIMTGLFLIMINRKLPNVCYRCGVRDET